MAQKQGFQTSSGNHVISFGWNLCKMKVLMVHRHSAKTACEKNLVLKLAKNGSRPMRFQYSVFQI